MSAQDHLALGPSVHPWAICGTHRIRFGISGAPQNWPEMHDFAQMTEGLGFDSLWRIDHPMLGHECWATLAAAAAVTRTIRLGTHVSCVAYRNPVLLARMAADIDAISNGRLVLGRGLGVFNTFRLVGSVLGIAILVSVLTGQLHTNLEQASRTAGALAHAAVSDAVRTTWLFAALCAVMGFVSALLLFAMHRPLTRKETLADVTENA